MAPKAKFLFDYSFDERADDDAARKAAAVADQARLQAELDAAYARGHEAGLTEAAAGLTQRLADATAAMTDGLAGIERARAEIERSTTAAAIRLALAILRKILPSLEGRAALPEIEAMFADCLPRALDEPRIVFRVPDDLLDALGGRIDEMARRAGFLGKVVLLADGGLGASDCRLEWADGGAERSVERLWSDIEDLVRRALPEPLDPLRAAAPAAPVN
jgi:flagellar assembly protein FliH